MSVYVRGLVPTLIGARFFQCLIHVFPEVLAHLLAHLFHEASHALRIILVKISKLARIRH